MEKAIIVAIEAAKSKKEKAREEALDEINQHLSEGWIVKSTSAMSGIALHIATSLVILEKY